MASSARIDELRKKFDENPRRYFAPLANEYRKSGDLDQAIFICQEYLPQQPGHMSGHIVYGQALFELARHDEARAVFETALSLDPENLIALRHLGDIARQAGDTRGARVWYQRVLEADPRNEEIAQLMLSLLATPDVGEAGTSPSGREHDALLGIGTQSNSIDDTARRDVAHHAEAETPLDIEKSESRSDLTVGPELSALPERQIPPEDSIPVEPATWGAPAFAADDLLDLNDFSVGGVPLSSLSGTPSIEEPEPGPFVESTILDALQGNKVDEDAFTEAPISDLQTFTEFGIGQSAFPDNETGLPEDAATVHGGDDRSGLDAGSDDVSFEADPFAIAARPEPTVEADETLEELAADISLGLPDDGTAPSMSDARTDVNSDAGLELESFAEGFISSASEPTATVSEDAVFGATEADIASESDTPADRAPDEATHDEDFVIAAATEIAAIELEPQPEPVLDVLETMLEDQALVAAEAVGNEGAMPDLAENAADAVVPDPETAPIDGGHDGQETLVEAGAGDAAAEPSDAFMTETMAELYLQQGHVDAALDIYQQLVAQRPDEPQLRDRLRAIEGRVHGTSAAFQAETDTEADAPFAAIHHAAEAMESIAVADGPTIREFLASVLHPSPSEPTLTTDEPSGDVPLAEESMERGPTSSNRATPASSGTITGSIDALFSGAATSEIDDDAAAALADAFAEDAPTDAPPLEGMPARRAASELSLDHVFKTPQAPRAQADSPGFSFDEFFAEDLGDTQPKPGTEAPATPADPGDDIAQFNNWLNGLKKT